MTEAEELELLELEAEALRGQSNIRKAKSPEALQQEIVDAKQQVFNEMPWYDRFAAGAGKVAYMTGPGLVKRLWGKGKDVEELSAEYEIASELSGLSKIGEFTSDVALTGIPVTKASKFGGFAKFLKPKYAKATLQGGQSGIASAGIHQGQNLAETGEIDPLNAGIETAVSAVVPGSGTLLSKPLRNMADGIAQTAVKASKMIKGSKVMNKEQIDKFFKSYASLRGIYASAEKLSKQEDLLAQRFDEVMDGLAAGTKVDIQASISNAKNSINKQLASGRINTMQYQNMMKMTEDLSESLIPLMDENGIVNARVAQNFKKNTLDEIAQYDKPSKTGDIERGQIPKAKVARETRRQLSKQLEYLNPDLKEVNKEWAEMENLRPYIEDAVERASANRGFSLQDITTLGMAMMNPKAGIALGMSRAQKSPGLATGLYRASEGLAGSHPILGQGMRSGLNMALENPYIQETVPGLAGMRLRGEQ